MNTFRFTSIFASLITVLFFSSFALAESDVQKELSTLELQESIQAEKRLDKAVKQLRDIQVSLQEKFVLRKSLANKIKKEGSSASQDMIAELKELDSEIELLKKTFEQVATGGIDLSIFGIKDNEFDWKEELVLVVKPLIENVKGLTEKPRQIERLKGVIADKSEAKEVSINAIKSIEELKKQAETEDLKQRLANVEAEWLGRADDLDREVQLAQYQLDSLEGRDINWVDAFKDGSLNFVKGRGLTLLLVILVALIIWWIMRGLLFLIRKRNVESQDNSSKVYYRLAAYGYRLLTGVLIAVGVMMVLYIRRDLLMLAIVVVVFIGVVLALKNLLPQYIAESRILLNMGGVRERERIIYNGVPWEVISINMFSSFRNPELKGGFRLPISQMHSMISRTSINEPWFPSSEGDWILDETGEPVEVMTQTIDVIELKDLNAVCRYVPTDEYYRAGYQNVTRADKFRIAITFGIDYSTQKENIEEIENAFIDGLKREFSQTEFDEFTQELSANFQSAGDSSLNYLMMATFSSEAAYGYNRIKRLISRACVKVCTEQDWTIPFPQMSVHLESDDDAKTKD